MPAIIPASVSQRIAAFLADGKTGEITLHVKDGRVLKMHATEYWPLKEGSLCPGERGN